MIIPFLSFAGQASDAIALYESVFEVKDKKVFLFKEMPEDMKSNFPAGTDNYVMHSEMVINGTNIWIGDMVEGVTPGNVVSLSVPCTSQEVLLKAFGKLKEGGKVHMEPAKTFYSPLFATVQDKFGVIWHLICQ